MQNSNKSTVPLLDFVSKCNVGHNLVKEQFVVRKAIDINEHDRLSNTLRHNI
jgi:hypothetical protein